MYLLGEESIMLIECTECGHKVSDKADKCPECGCPMEDILKCLREKEIYITDDKEMNDSMLICNINGKRADVAWIKDIIDKMDETELYHCKYVWDKLKGKEDERFLCFQKYMGTPEQVYERKAHEVHIMVIQKYELSYSAAATFLCELVSSDFEMKEFDGMTEKEFQSMKAPIIHCPYCGSVDVRKTTFWSDHGLWRSVGKQWKCKGCGSYF